MKLKILPLNFILLKITKVDTENDKLVSLKELTLWVKWLFLKGGFPIKLQHVGHIHWDNFFDYG